MPRSRRSAFGVSRWSRRFPGPHRRSLAGLLALALIAQAWGLPALAEGGSAPTGREAALAAGHRASGPGSLARDIRAHSGGYGLLTPIIVTLTRVVETSADRNRGGQPSGEVLDFADEPRFWGGLAGDFLTTALFAGLAVALPAPPFLKAALPIAGGFIGWEIGSGNLSNTNWVSLAGQIAVVTATQIAVGAALSSVGFPAAGIVSSVAAAAAGIGFGLLFDRSQPGPRSEAEDGSGVSGREMRASDPAGWPAARSEAKAPTREQPAALGPAGRDAARRREFYERFVGALRAGRRSEAQELLEEFNASPAFGQ